MSTELKPCPFCASNDVAIHEHYTAGSYMVLCHNCTAEGPLHETKALASEWWNRRTAPVSAPLDTQALPPLTNDHIIEIADKTRTAESRAGDYILPISFARAIEAEIIAPYAERIRHLERELAERRLRKDVQEVADGVEALKGRVRAYGELAERKPASIGDDSEFLRLLGDWMAGLDYFQSDEHKEVKKAWDVLIAYIDGHTAGTAPASAETPSVEDAPRSHEWQPVTAPGQVRKGDKLRFKIGDKAYDERAKQILHPGTDKEEVIYDKGRNFYFITAMVMSGFSNHKCVEVRAAAPSSMSKGKEEAND